MLLDKSALPGFVPLPAAPLAVAGDRDETQPLVDPAEIALAASSVFNMAMPLEDTDLPSEPDEV